MERNLIEWHACWFRGAAMLRHSIVQHTPTAAPSISAPTTRTGCEILGSTKVNKASVQQGLDRNVVYVPVGCQFAVQQMFLWPLNTVDCEIFQQIITSHTRQRVVKGNGELAAGRATSKNDIRFSCLCQSLSSGLKLFKSPINSTGSPSRFS